MNKPTGVLMIALLMMAGVQQWRIGDAQAATDAAKVRGDSIAADMAAEHIAEEGLWEVEFATETDRLESLFTNADTARQRLVTELQDANVRLGLLAEVLASAQGEIVSIGERTQEDASQTLDTVRGTWAGDVDDGLLTGSWLFKLPEVEHTLSYGVEFEGELVASTTGDGRTLVTVRATHPRARLSIEGIFVQRPDPVIEVKLSKTQALVALIAGAFGWELAR